MSSQALQSKLEQLRRVLPKLRERMENAHEELRNATAARAFAETMGDGDKRVVFSFGSARVDYGMVDHDMACALLKEHERVAERTFVTAQRRLGQQNETLQELVGRLGES